MANQVLPWYQRLVARHLARRERLFADQPANDERDGFAHRQLKQSGFDLGLPYLPDHLIERLDPDQGGSRVILFAFTRWTLEVLDQALIRGGKLVSDDELQQEHCRLIAALTDSSDRVEVMGDALETLGLTQGLPIAGLPLLAGLTSVEAYNAMTWIMARVNDQLSEENQASLAREARQRRLQLAGMLLMMNAVDKQLPDFAFKTIKKQLNNLRVSRSGKARLDSWLYHLPNAQEIMDLADGLPPLELIRAGLVAAAIDGHQSEAELTTLSALATAGGMQEEQLDQLGAQVAQRLFMQHKLVERLWTSDRRQALNRSHLAAQLRINSERVINELKETGDSLNLLRKSAMGKSLSHEEWGTLRSTLSDLGRTVPALAIFAMPGGALLLPAAAKALPFDLRPSSFRESHLAPSWFGELADAETLFLDEPTHEVKDVSSEDE